MCALKIIRRKLDEGWLLDGMEEYTMPSERKAMWNELCRLCQSCTRQAFEKRLKGLGITASRIRQRRDAHAGKPKSRN